jgi:triosephosphate isomerase
MLTDCGLDLVEIGHSERRTHFGETDETVGLKTAAATRHGLVPLVCIGETAADKASGRAEAVLAAQVEAAFAPLDAAALAQPILLAYEPVWAIGAGGTPATPDYAEARQAGIAAVARRVAGRHVPCLYGGNVNAENCTDLIARPHVDGLFIGRAAWAIEGYLDILARCARAI